jgi:hypothetical protein
MTMLPLFYTAMVALAGAIAGLALWARVRRPIKALVLTLTAAWLVVAYGALAELLSRPKPVDLEFARAGMPEAEVLAGRVVEDEAIYLWLDFLDDGEPRAYRLPFDHETAEQLRKAMEQGDETGGGVRMRLPFAPSLDDGEPRFYAPPQPRLPLKPVEPGDEHGPMRFDNPGAAA